MGQTDNAKMDRKGRATQRPKGAPYARTDSEFVNRELSLEETTQFRVWREDVESVLAFWDEEVNSGYKFSAKYDDYSSSFAVFMFPSEGSDNTGWILTGRGGTTYRALAEALYKHRVIFQGIWVGSSSFGGPSGDPDW